MKTNNKMDIVGKVREWYNTFNLPYSEKPTLSLDFDRMSLRMALLDEESRELRDAQRQRNLPGIADGIIDCMYVLIGTALEYGIGDKLYDLFAEVHDSNMSKLDENGKPIYRATDGKIMKGPNYFKPNLEPLLKKSLHE